MNDEAIVLAFLSANNQQKVILDLSQEQISNLDSFLGWLKGFRREQNWTQHSKFLKLRQNDLCFKNFALKLKKLFRAAWDIEGDSDLTPCQLEQIKRQFLNNIKDKRIKPQIRHKINASSLDDLVQQCEDLAAEFELEDDSESSDTPVTAKVNLASEDKILMALKSFKSDQDSKIKLLEQQIEKIQLNNSDPSNSNRNESVHFRDDNQRRSRETSRYRDDRRYRDNSSYRDDRRYRDNSRYRDDSRYRSENRLSDYRSRAKSPFRQQIFCESCQSESHSNSDCRRAHRDEYLNNRPFCRYCKSLGHKSDRCFKLNRKREREFSENFNRNPRNSDRPSDNNRSRHSVNFTEPEQAPRDLYSEN